MPAETGNGVGMTGERKKEMRCVWDDKRGRERDVYEMTGEG